MISRHENSHYVPIFCDLRNKKVVVVGGGAVAERKVRSLVPSGARITLISPRITEGLRELVGNRQVTHVERPFRQGDLQEAWLVIAATDDDEVQEQVFQEAERQQCLCNVVDEPQRCSFIVPSVVRRGALAIAISTGGQSPALARRLRIELERQFGDEWATYVELIGRLRRLILSKVPEEERAQRLEMLVEAPCLVWIGEKKWEKIAKWAIEICGQDANEIVEEFIS